ncbi:MAG: hypothetical protein A2096_06840 [Spirochaetes bacterium GWF1_41_5]|nr:MAG: hypothetical protein A2096_06840 [Spirochaetes bacterium GWF1_41_5]HBE04026.1 hypothetical protein [Spirochaetia bacterium]
MKDNKSVFNIRLLIILNKRLAAPQNTFTKYIKIMKKNILKFLLISYRIRKYSIYPNNQLRSLTNY